MRSTFGFSNKMDYSDATSCVDDDGERNNDYDWNGAF